METLRLPARLDNLDRIRSFVLNQAGDLGFPRELLFRVDLVVDELVTNIILYAYPNEAGNVEIGCAMESPCAMRIEIRDQGQPFDPTMQAEPDIDQEFSERDIGGLGIYLVRRMANGLCYQRGENENILTITFQF
jgi:serine/threonine-protein kinase RsbW